MLEIDHLHERMVLLVGLVVVLAALIKALFRRTVVPALVGYLLLGFLLRLADEQWAILDRPIRNTLSFLADFGLVALLFSVGLSSDPRQLARKLPSASFIWISNVFASGALGFAVAYYLLGLGYAPSLVIGTALTATSVGVSLSPWTEVGALNSGAGQLLLDVAELDDISAIVLMALMLALLPMAQIGGAGLLSVAGATAVGFIAKLVAFALFCYLFARYVERRITTFAARLETPPERLLTVVGLGFLIAAAAGWLGFSLAIGALFAGLVFSRDPVTTKIQPSFATLYEFFVPFFFIGIGLRLDPQALAVGLELGLWLLAAGVLGKLLGAGLPVWFMSSWHNAALIGVSMVPRAEIAMVVVEQARRGFGAWAVPDKVYAAMVVVVAGSSLAAPLAVRPLLRRWRGP